MQFYMVLTLSMLYQHSTATLLTSFLKHVQRRTDPEVKCYQCYSGPLAAAISPLLTFTPAAIEHHHSCFGTDKLPESVPSVECAGRCMTMLLAGNHVDYNIVRTCVPDSSYASPYVNYASYSKIAGTVDSVDKLANLLNLMGFGTNGPVWRSYFSQLKPGILSLNMAYCDAQETPTICDPPYSHPDTDLPAVLTSPTECSSCYQGDLAQQIFKYQAHDRSLVGLMNGRLSYGEDGQCSASADDKDCSGQKCLGVVLAAAGTESNIMKVCFPVSSYAATMFLENYNPFSDVTIQEIYIEDFKDTAIRALMEPIKDDAVGAALLTYADQIKAGQTSLKIVSIN